ncbi:DUF4369 domain-containing protein [Winogradskyella sp. PE311]|uniref:DUF4369 domain-containing protein n=1 Tax=Winogradskyella sp. PE311 TaxID=3366943 RepID=UPI00397EB9B9
MTKIYKFLSITLLAFLAISCSNDNEGNFTLKGNIKGLKKGVVYLQKNLDSTDIINLDSLVIAGQSEFTLKTTIDEPVLLYLKLFKNDGEEHYIPFFADEGITEIKTSLKNFNFDAKINGSRQQALLNEYTDIMSQFNNQNLDLIEANFLAQKANDTITSDSLNKQSQKLIKRKYAYTIQFAMNNKDSEIAPYLALYEIPAANPIYIDSVYNGLTNEIKNSLYGRKLKEFIAERKLAN